MRVHPVWQVNKNAAPGPFYANLLAVHRFWERTFRNESRVELALPELETTNGTWLDLQAKHGQVNGMITRVDTWFPRYGVSPGYGAQADPGNGFQVSAATVGPSRVRLTPTVAMASRTR